MPTRFPRSCYDLTGGLVYFARMLDKIRLHAKGELPKEYHENLGDGFDARCCTFLGVKYQDVKNRTLQDGSDDDVLEACFQTGRRPSADDIADWNEFMLKRGWRDRATPRLRMRVKEAKLDPSRGEILTFFDFIEADEGRTPPKFP